MHSEIEVVAERICNSQGSERSSAIANLMNELIPDSILVTEVYMTCVNLCERGVLKAVDMAPYSAAAEQAWGEVFEQALPLQGDESKTHWRIDDGYTIVRGRAEWLLDLLAYFPGAGVSQCLRQALKLPDPRLRLYAVYSLLRCGEHVELEDIEKVACDHETRILLSRYLRELERESLMPAKWSTPVMLAASQLSPVGKQNALPEEIELMQTFPVEVDDKTLDAFLFRFRESPESMDSSGIWMAGIAGPYLDTLQMKSAWTDFEDWDSRTPLGHFEALTGMRREVPK